MEHLMPRQAGDCVERRRKFSFSFLIAAHRSFQPSDYFYLAAPLELHWRYAGIAAALRCADDSLNRPLLAGTARPYAGSRQRSSI